MMVLRASAVALAFALASCSPAAEAPAAKSGVDIPTPNNPFFGAWEMTASAVAPWWDQAGPEPAAEPDMAKFTLAADKSSGPPLLTCDKPSYATNITPQRGLFEGNLPDPAKDAAALGFTSPDIVTLSFSCPSATADVSLDFPMLNDNTILLGLSNVIYTYRRASN
jgi:hypothetical protein